MRTFVSLCSALLLAIAAEGVALRASCDKQATAERIAELVNQLGDDEFDKREAASKALAAIGEPARAALQKATSSDDLETRRRAARLLGVLRVQAENRELRKWEGTWRRSDNMKLTLEGD